MRRLEKDEMTLSVVGDFAIVGAYEHPPGSVYKVKVRYRTFRIAPAPGS